MSQSIVLGPVRTTYCFVWKPQETDRIDDKTGEKVLQYSTALLIPKNGADTQSMLAQINQAIEAAKQEGARTKWGGTIPPGLKLPLRDGDSANDKKSADKNYNGHWFLNATGEKKPGLIYENGDTIIEPRDMQSGYWVLASLKFYPFKAKGNEGVAVGLNNLMLVRKDTVLGGVADAQDDFKNFIKKSGAGPGDTPAAGGFGGTKAPGGFL
jgi:hypothetical protein